MKFFFITFLSFLTSISLAGNLSALVGSGGGSGSCGPTFAGYTTLTYDGNMGLIKGMNAKCHADYSGSHACTYDEIIKLGNSYPYTEAAWVIDGAIVSSYTSNAAFQIAKSGDVYMAGATANLTPFCVGWSYDSTSSYVAPVMGTLGNIFFASCSDPYKIPCCKN